jgi:hypothetical protein
MSVNPTGQGPVSQPDASVSPYLLRPCRSLEQARRDLRESAILGSHEGYRADSPAGPAKQRAWT